MVADKSASSVGEIYQAHLRRNLSITCLLVAFFLMGVTLRLWHLQIRRGDFFRERAENNRLRTLFSYAPRGVVYDRNGKVLALSRPLYKLEIVPEDVVDLDEVLLKLSRIVGKDLKDLRDAYQKGINRSRHQPIVLLNDIDRDLVGKILVRKYDLSGVQIGLVPTRNYLYSELVSHALGYIREISEAQLASSAYKDYRLGDLVGQSGIEARYENSLRGKNGKTQLIVNARGTKVKQYPLAAEVAGSDLKLTIDIELQKIADAALGDRTGAVVGLNPKNGEVLLLLSKPAFNPNLFSEALPPRIWNELLSGSRALNNRATQGTYPPGSVFKVFMLIAGLEEGVINSSFKAHCPGFYHFAGRDYKCHKKGGHGEVDLYSALVQSCDVYFYKLGERLGIDRIAKYAKLFGFGKITGIDLDSEKRGIVPSSEWKKMAFKKPEQQKWYAGETLSVAIGQGALTTTPLQIARALAAVVNGGTLFAPTILLGEKASSVRLRLKEDSLNLVKEALLGVVADESGTGKLAALPKDFGIKVGGKTGTAQVVSLAMIKGRKELDHHAWFAGYAPHEDPEIVVVALVEHGGHGGVEAAPIVGKVLERYFSKRFLHGPGY
ncbi:MAG TPA: penicillin-binding protein 2 [Oligoflexia bacterium]|nr:penicillin-binding protein 2 [Oligoflexia bacterium]HMP26725.1 penicillin-binding protein 2 [Oligoflexia bacterium]